MRKSAVNFSVIGPGKVGSSVARALVELGWRCSSIVYKSKSKAKLKELRSNFPHAFITNSIPELKPDFDLLLITVNDDAIERVTSELSELTDFDWKGKVVLHVSGVVELETLSGLRDLGAHVGALHPIAAFAREFSTERAEEIYYDFLGDKHCLDAARKITAALNSKLLILNSERERVLLHLASVIASNSVVIAVRSAEDLISNFVDANDSKVILERLLGSTVENLSTLHNMNALTGPLKRGDANVISKHIKALENDELFLQFYKSLSRLGIEALLKNESDKSRKTRLNKIKKLLEDK